MVAHLNFGNSFEPQNLEPHSVLYKQVWGYSHRYGDIHAVSEAEKWYSLLSMLWDVVMFGIILGTLASVFTNHDATRAKYIHRLDAIKDRMVGVVTLYLPYRHFLHAQKKSKLSQDLQQRVIGYYEYLVR